jgi:hypothetical protein
VIRAKHWYQLVLGLLLPLPAVADPAIQWQPADGTSLVGRSQLPEWQALPASTLVPPASSDVTWQAADPLSQMPRDVSVVWQPLQPGEPDFPELAPRDPAIAAQSIPLPPAPSLQTFNRSIAFSDGVVGPDIAWLVPQGFRWSSEKRLDFSLLGSNRRGSETSFWAWNNGDAVAQFHLKLFQAESLTFGVNASFRSVYQGAGFSGGSTSVGEGFSSGFRLDYNFTDTLGIALGAEQLILYDDKTDTGRNIYLVLSKAWWLGGRPGQYPLFLATGGLGSGSLALNRDLQIGCVDVPGGAAISTEAYYPLCWGPVASTAFVFNQYLSLIAEFNSDYILAGSSLALSNTLPMRITWGVLFADKGVDYSYVGNNNLRWFFRASIGF